MAWMNQDKKKIIRENLKKVIPTSWKWSLSVHNHSSIILTIKSAPVNLLVNDTHNRGYGQIYQYSIDKDYDKGVATILHLICDAMKSAGWYNNTDIQTDYFDTAYYIDMNIGSWDKPFEVK